MLHQVVDIQQENQYLSLERGFLQIRAKDATVVNVPLDNIAVLMVSAQSASFSKHILTELSQRGAISVLCGQNYAPQSIVFPLSGHYLHAGILKEQINCSLPFQKNIWKQIIEQKLSHQAISLRFCGKDKESNMLFKISRMVKSGDTTNREAYGARLYWKFLFGDDFVRDRNSDGVNAALNYGYAILRSAMARAICSAGLLPSLGVFHHNKLNPFCLADDLFEPFRPIVDMVVFQLVNEYFKKNPENKIEVTADVKRQLVKILHYKLKTSEGSSPLVQGMQNLAFSFANAIHEKRAHIDIPHWEGTYENSST